MIVSTQFQCQLNQFTCQSGECIPIGRRCNQIIDCEDFSDENHCKRIGHHGLTYKKKIPPKLSENQKLKVSIGITLESLSQINELNMMFRSRVTLQASWKDVRLYFNDLKEGFNILDSSEMVEIWRPSLILSNSEKMLYVLDNPHLFVQILRASNGTLVEETNLHESMRYMGSENEIIMISRFETEFFCIYKLENYPFDVQYCSIDILAAHNIMEDVSLVPGVFLDLSSQGSTMQFSRNLIKINTTDNGTLLQGIIELKRMPQFHLYCTYLPTFCIICICICTLYINEKHFEATIMVSLTAMLVLYTLFQGISVEIPSTAYLKLIDVWLIFTLVLPFGVFLIQFSWAIWPVEKEQVRYIKVGEIKQRTMIMVPDQTRKSFKMLCQKAIPVLCVAFLIFYFQKVFEVSK